MSVFPCVCHILEPYQNGASYDHEIFTVGCLKDYRNEAHISRVNCAKITRDTLGQPVSEIFSIEHTFLAI